MAKDEILERKSDVFHRIRRYPDGDVLIAGQDRVTLNGEKADGVKKTIVERGSISAEIQYLEFEVSGKMRFPSFKRIYGCR